MLKHLKHKGDTIVEVLIAIGVISLVLTAAYVTANRNYLTMQDAQEHGNALKLLERQTEALKAYNVDHHSQLVSYVNSGANLCMTIGAAGAVTPATPSNLSVVNPCVTNSAGTQAAANEQPAYTIQITKVPGVSIGTGQDFMLRATWDSILGSGKASAQMEYGLY